ncbi:MAG: hypothetical protein MUF10_13345, partial [Thermoanaerobaculaceae bacterium]|nr:hypothetical protein [Thermoanaerobaculaceae bacterium]
MCKASPWRVVVLSIVLLALGVPAPTAQPASWPSMVVRVGFPPGTDLAALARGLDVWEVHRSEGFLVAAVDPGQWADLEARGFVLELDEARSARLDRPLVLLPGQTSGIPSFPCYRTVEETYASMEGLVSAHPGLASWVDIGDSWEKVTAGGNPGYDLRVLVLTNSAHPGA